MIQLKAAIVIVFSVLTLGAGAQLYNEYVYQGEVGITAGAAHYFGDLNTRARLNRPKPALGIFFRKQFGNYVAMRLSAHYARLGYSDIYSDNEYQKKRNLSFNSNIWEVALQGDFNFFKFVPGDPNHLFTPYFTIGAGLFSYDPFAFLDGKKEFLRPLGTEGQNAGFEGRTQYGSMAFCFPVGVGVKYNITNNINISFEISNRFTTTDYLDDVSTTYAGADKFLNDPIANSLQDRSVEIDPNDPLGIEGRQRGWSKQKDQYIIAEIGIGFNLSSYRCPTAK